MPRIRGSAAEGDVFRPRNGIHMNAKMKTLTAIAVVAAMCLCPLFTAADGSDAYDVTPGETGLSVTMYGLSKEKAGELYTPSAMGSRAEQVAQTLIGDSMAGTSLSAPEMSDLSVERGLASSVTDDTTYLYRGAYEEYTITFTLTFTDVRDILISNEAFIDVMKAIGTDNKSAVGDRLEITAKVQAAEASEEIRYFVKNADGSFVETGKDTSDYQSSKYDITARFVRESPAKDVSFSVEFYTEEGGYLGVEYDFDGVEPKEATAETTVYLDNDVGGRIRNVVKCIVDGKTRDYDETYDMMVYGGSEVIEKATIYDSDITVPTFTYLGTDEMSCLFMSSDVVPATEEEMRAFADANGSTDETYSGAKEIYDSNYINLFFRDLLGGILKTVGIILIAYVVLLVLIVLIVVLIVKKMKK